MEIVVCVKPIPDPGYWARLPLDPKTHTLRREGIPNVLGLLDKCALEEALRIRDSCGGKVTVVSMAPLSTSGTLYQTLAMGADEVVLLSDRCFAGADTLATSYVLATAIKKLGQYHLVLCGDRSLDVGTGQVAPQVAEFLAIPHVCHVLKIDLFDGGRARVKAKTDDGHIILETDLPAVLAVHRGINQPRLVSLMGLVAAREREIKVWGAGDLEVDPDRVGLVGSPTQVAQVFAPQRRRHGELLQGEAEEMVRSLMARLERAGVMPT